MHSPDDNAIADLELSGGFSSCNDDGAPCFMADQRYLGQAHGGRNVIEAT
jgi:hypothetical protein